MRIVLTAPLEEPVPPQKYGGTELVIGNLCEEFVKLGHDVYLLASGDSHTSAKLVPIIPISLRAAYTAEEFSQKREFLKFYYMRLYLEEIQRLHPDVVYNHLGWRLGVFESFIPSPMYTTIHGPLTSFAERFTYKNSPNIKLVSISNNQRRALPRANWVKTVYNGIQLPEINGPQIPPISARDYFVFLGRISPEKGLHEICQLIRSSPYKLKIAAKIDPIDIEYFEQKVKPLIDGEQIKFIGEVGPEEKSQLLQHAKALLLWLNWEEPFGLVIVESMANGTPVIVNKKGAMAELVFDGKTGYLVNTLEEFRARLDQLDGLDPEQCIAHVEKKFSSTRMAREYLKLRKSDL